MPELVIYEKSTCSKCRAAGHLLDASGKPYRRVRYHEKPLSPKKLMELIGKSGLPPASFVRAKEAAWKALGKDASALSVREIAELLAAHPDLIERPILECGNRATLGRPLERAAAFIASC